MISLIDGKKLGRITDAFVTSNGVIEYFNVMPYHFWRFWKSSNELTIRFDQIKKIGTDVILVEIE